MIISHFPPEILGLILQESALVLALWKCGSFALNASLASGVRNVVLSHISGFDLTVPRVLLELRSLKTLGLRSPRTLSKTISWSTFLATLPSGLESLSFDSQDGAQAFLDCSEAPSKHLQLGSFFPNLHSLTMSSPWLRIGADFLKALPPTLTLLELGGNSLLLSCLGSLPPSLTLLKTTLRVGAVSARSMVSDLKDLELAPPGICISKIELSFTDDLELLQRLHQHLLKLDVTIRYSFESISLLPRSITALTLPLNFTMPGDVSALQACAAHWPPALVWLSIRLDSLESRIIGALPRSLTHLHLILEVPRDSVLITEELSSQLTSFIFEPKFSDVVINGQLPSTLTSVECKGTSPDRMSNLLGSLPTSLLRLRVNPPSPKQAEFLAWTFPPRITSLHLHLMRPESFAKIPRSVTSLTLDMLYITASTPQSDPKFFSTLGSGITVLKILRIESEVCTLHPRSLDHLTCLKSLCLPSTLKLPISSIQYLPRSLTTLQVEIQDIEKNPSNLQFLPPNLTRCSLARSPTLTEVLDQHWPPTAWRCLVEMAPSLTIKKLLDRC